MNNPETTAAPPAKRSAPLAGPLGILCGLLLSQAATDPETKAFGLRLGRWATVGIGGVLLVGSPTLVVLGELDIPLVNGILLSLAGLGMLIMAWRMPRLDFPRGSRFAGLLGVLAVGLWGRARPGMVPHRTHSRSLAPVAESFRPHLPESGSLWGGAGTRRVQTLVLGVLTGASHHHLCPGSATPRRVPGHSVHRRDAGFRRRADALPHPRKATRRGVRIAIVEVAD